MLFLRDLMGSGESSVYGGASGGSPSVMGKVGVVVMMVFAYDNGCCVFYCFLACVGGCSAT